MKRICIIALATVLSFTCIFPVMAIGTDAEKKMNDIDSKLNSINRLKDKISKEKNKLEEDKKELLNTQKEESKEFQKLSSELETISKDISAYEDALKESEDKYNKQMEQFRVRLAAMYENSYISYLEILSQSKSLVDFFERFEIIASIAKKDKELIESIGNVKNDVEYKKALVESIKLDKQNELDKKQKTIDSLLATRAGLDERIKKNKKELERLERQEDKLIEQSGEIGDQIRGTTKGGKGYAGGTMIWPVPSSRKIDSPYGMRIHPILKKKKMHTGIDIDAEHGASIVAANKGRVIFSGWKNGYGYTVIVDHGGGITTLYAHCSRLLVKKGDTVKAGQTIAKAGRTGLATGTHLHFEVRKNGDVTNPLNYVSP